MGARRINVLPGADITNDRCLILDDGPTAVIGDLHLGYECALEDEGLFIPRMNEVSIKESLNRILDAYEPARVVLLGDIKHDFRRSSYSARDEVRDVVRLISDAAECVAIRGNHDNYLQNILSDVGIIALDHVNIGGYRLEHGHVDSGVRPVIIGHEHPSVKIPGELSGGMKLQCYVVARGEGVVVIPPFSPFASGNDLNPGRDAVMAPALRSCDISKAEIYAVSDMGLMQLGRLDDVSMLSLRRASSHLCGGITSNQSIFPGHDFNILYRKANRLRKENLFMAMTCRDRITAAMNLETLDRPPVAVFTQAATVAQMDAVGAAWPEAHKDANLMAKLATAQHTHNGTECYRTCFCLTAEAEALGCNVLVEKKTDAPMMKSHPFKFDPLSEEYDDPSAIMPIEDFLKTGRVATIIKSCEILRGPEYDSANVPIVAGNTGPFTLTGHLVNTENLIFGMMMDPTKVDTWVQAVTPYVKAYSQALIDAGADIIQMSEPSGSTDMLSPDMFQEAAGIAVGNSLGQTTGGLGNILHICGDTLPILEQMASIGGSVKGVSIEEKVDSFKAYEHVGGKTVLVGNVGSVKPLFTGTPEEVKEGTLKSCQAGFNIISSGCGIATGTPDANYNMMVETVKNFTR